MDAKVYVQVVADFNIDGMMLPRVVIWEDGEKYVIDRLIDIRQAAARKAGGQGDRFTIEIRGQISYLFFERVPQLTGNLLGRWFVERKASRKEIERS